MANPDRPSTLRGKLSRSMFFGTSLDLPRIVEVDLGRLTPNPDQPRKTFDEAALRELADSIERHGLIQPVTVKEAADDRPGGQGFQSAADRGRQHQPFGIVIVHVDMDPFAVAAKAEAVAAVDRQEG